ncbi:MAG: hypothetical protein JW729_04400 [Bacteroidales bacterium]|nr:hypothetical protein [Bacteroidales bacterium]
MKKHAILLLSLLSLFNGAFAQDQTTRNTANHDSLTLNQAPKTEMNYSLPGLYNVTTIGILSGSSQNRQAAPFSFQSLLMYPLTSHMALGGGLGVEFLEETYIPIVADFRYYLRTSRFSPFAFVQAGYSLSTSKKANEYVIYDYYSYWPGYYPQYEDLKPLGGFLINPGFGVKHMFNPDFGFEISFSYRYQRLNYEYLPTNRIEANYNRLNIRLGILFH